MGSALSHALGEALSDTGPAHQLPTEFSRAFTDATGIVESRYAVSPDTLSTELMNAREALQAVQTLRGTASETSWTATVSRRLQEMAIPVFDRRQQITPNTATPIRLAALCLAGEAAALDEPKLGEVFRNISTSITLLERRANGTSTATETIFLASE